MDEVAKALKVPVEAIKNFDEEKANTFFNSFHDNSGFNYQCTFNAIDKIVELYERMIKEKEAMIEELRKN